MKCPLKKKGDEDGGDDDWGGDNNNNNDNNDNNTTNNDDWGEMTEDNIDNMITDTEFDEWRNRRKQWKKKEEYLRSILTIDESKKKKQIFSSDAASGIIMKALEDFMKNGENKGGFIVEPVEDNIFQWNIKIINFPHDTSLYRDLMKLKSKYSSINYIEIEIKFPMDLYPFYPPSVRLIRPKLKNFMIGRLVMMNEIQLNYWNPIRSIGDILIAIKNLLLKYGEIDLDHDPRLQPYTAIEFELLRLSMLTEIQPRIMTFMSDEERAALGKKPKAAPSNPTTSKDSSSSSSSASKNSSSSSSSKSYWAKGTGYGHGDAHSGPEWDPEAYLAAQQKKTADISAICQEVLLFLKRDQLEAGTDEIIAQSCMLPFLEEYFKTDSITEMEKFSDFFHLLFDIGIALCSHETTCRLLFIPTSGESSSKTLELLIDSLKSQAAIVEKFSTLAASASESSSTTSLPHLPYYKAKPKNNNNNNNSTDSEQPKSKYTISLSAHILQLADALAKGTELIKKIDAEKKAALEEKEAKEAAASSSSSSSSSNNNNNNDSGKNESDGDIYIKFMSQFRFGELEKFGHHHYEGGHSSKAGDTNLTRDCVKRLSVEYGDLSKSLPITHDSSIYFRVHESKMNFAQMIISAPDDTPYSQGLFLFDIVYPSQYPNVPPLVNLQTTGGGTVRFNPNLYADGKVCLSLLGTWSGSQGESWNPKASTMLQVAVSIQALILVPEPFFNEPSYEREIGTPSGNSKSKAYNDNIKTQTVKWAMIEMMQRPPFGWEDVIRSHFYFRKNKILSVVTEWAKGTPGVQSLIPQLKTELEKLPVPKNNNSSASA